VETAFGFYHLSLHAFAAVKQDLLSFSLYQYGR